VVSGQLLASAALTRGNETSVPVGYEAERIPQVGLDCRGKRKVVPVLN